MDGCWATTAQAACLLPQKLNLDSDTKRRLQHPALCHWDTGTLGREGFRKASSVLGVNIVRGGPFPVVVTLTGEHMLPGSCLNRGVEDGCGVVLGNGDGVGVEEDVRASRVRVSFVWGYGNVALLCMVRKRRYSLSGQGSNPDVGTVY